MSTADWARTKNKMPARPLAPVRRGSMYTAEQEMAIEEGLLATNPTYGYPSTSSSSSSSSSYAPLHPHSHTHSHAQPQQSQTPPPNSSQWTLSPWSLMAAYRLYASIPSKMRTAPTLLPSLSSSASSSSVPFAVSIAAHLVAVGGRRVRIQQLLLTACAALVLALVLLTTARPVCHHNSSSCELQLCLANFFAVAVSAFICLFSSSCSLFFF
ncbi:hypothetical protein BJ741DRAFT_605960 [Chytriomyces cf. hyalinus JEL632]|nr:hypothetical protein BJ741DRAFT_605960 [Chytriomyces cf. hyalinus JEL632]